MQRETCTAKRSRQHRYCSAVCHAVDAQMDRAQRICEAVGANEGSRLWALAVEMSDSLTEIRMLESHLKTVAQSVGMSEVKWNAVVTGDYRTVEPES